MNDFKVGDRIVHPLHGEGVVIKHERANQNGVPVKFDSGHTNTYSWGYLADPALLTKILIQENE